MGKILGKNESQINIGITNYLIKTIEIIKKANEINLPFVLNYMYGVPGTDWTTIKEEQEFFFKKKYNGKSLIEKYFITLKLNKYMAYIGTNTYKTAKREFGTKFHYPQWWKIFRSFKSTSLPSEPKTYAYPNPFSPQRHNVYGGEGQVRFQYHTTGSTTVTVKVYDFGMNLVKTVVENKPRAFAGDYGEVWNGRNGLGEMVANGVYFYKIKLKGQSAFWGKVMVLN